MILTPEQRWKAEHEIDVDSSSNRKRGSSRLKLWPGGIIVYAIDWRLGKCFTNHVTLFLNLNQSVNNQTPCSCQCRTKNSRYNFFCS